MKLNICCVENLKHAVEECLNLVKMVHGPVCIIVPDKLSVTMEKTMFAKLNIEASFDIEVSTLTRLSQSILAETNVDFKPISKLGSVILIKKILNENKSNLKLFNSNYFSYSYSDVLFRTLTQFKSSKINSNDMLTEDINSPQLKSKIEDIRLILEEYESQKAGLVDSCDRLNLFAVNLHKSKKIKNTHFFFVGFDDLTTQGYSVVEELIKNSLSVSFMTYRSKHKNKHLYSNEVFEKLINICKISNLNYEVLDSEYENNDLQKFISNNLLAINAEKFNLNNNEISLHNAKNSLEEIEFVARDIRKQILKGHHFYEFGVGCFDLEKNANNIKNIFAKYDLNCYIDCSRPLISTSYYKFIENYIQLFVKNFQLENIISLINSEFIPFTNKTKNEINEILIELDYSGHLKYLKLDDLYSEEYQFLINLLSECEIKKEFGIFQLKDMINKLNSVLNIEEKILLDIDLTNDLNSKKILSQQIKAFNQLLDEISTFYPNAQIDEIYDIINSCAIEQKIMPIPQSIDSIQVVDASEILTNFENLYVINCNHSTAPQINQDTGVILDKDIANLKLKNKLSPTIAHLNKLARFKLFNSIQMFDKSLHICSSVNSETEKSEVVKDFEKLFLVNNSPISVHLELENNIAISKWDLVEKVTKNKCAENDEILNQFEIKRYKPIKYLTAESIKNINFTEISCSALENYFKCPMLYFIKDLLNLSEERQKGIAKIDIGNILHELAEDFYKVFDRQKLNLVNFAETNIKKYMEKDRKLSRYINSPIYRNLVDEAVRFLNHLNYLDENSLFNIAFCEYNFDSKFSKSIPLAENVFLRGKIDRVDFYDKYIRIIDYKTGSVSASLTELYYGKKLQLFLYGIVCASIFNKELAGTFYLPVKNEILDEDTTAKPYKLTGYYLNNLNIAKALDKRIFEREKSDIVNLNLNKDGEIRTDARSNKVLYPNEFNNLLDYSVKLSNQAINEIKKGYIAPSPIEYDSQSNSCTFCPYLAICRKNSAEIKFRTMENINLTSFGGENG